MDRANRVFLVWHPPSRAVGLVRLPGPLVLVVIVFFLLLLLLLLFLVIGRAFILPTTTIEMQENSLR